MSKLNTFFTAIILMFMAVSCKKAEMPLQTYGGEENLIVSSKQNTNQSSNRIIEPAYFDSVMFSVAFAELSKPAELQHNQDFKYIYVFDDGLPPNNVPFVSVLNSHPGDGGKGVWRKVVIMFNAGFIPHQFLSGEDIWVAATGPIPEITLNMTDKVYRTHVSDHETGDLILGK